MNNSNNFNVCSRYGSANSLSAKYCYQCGSQLKLPDQPVVCPQCNSINSGMANFCRSCGAMLKSSSKTKLCPRCKKQLALDQAKCSCGYTFTNIANIDQSTPTKQRGGRLVALLSLVFTAIFALALTLPFKFLQDFTLTSNLYTIGISADSAIFALGIVDMVYLVVEIVNQLTPEAITELIPLMVLLLYVAIALVTMVVQAICALIRLIHGKRGKHVNVFYIVMAVITGSIAAMLLLANLGMTATLPPQLANYLQMYVMPEGILVGWGIVVIPLYYLFFFVFSFFAKRKKAKTKAQNTTK